MLILLCAVVSAASVETAFRILGPIIGDFLQPEETLQLAWSHFIQHNDTANALTRELVSLTQTESNREAIAEFYFSNQQALDELMAMYHGDILSPCIEATNQTCAVVFHVLYFLERYIERWKSSCMFKYLPGALQRDYDDMFTSENMSVVANDTAWRSRLRLRPGVTVTSVLKLNATSETVPIAARKMEMSHLHRIVIANSHATHLPTAAIFLDSRAGCAIKTRNVGLFILPTSRTAAYFTNFSSVVATRGAMKSWIELARFDRCDYCRLEMFMKDVVNGGYLFGLRANPLQRLHVYNSNHLQMPLVSGLYASSRYGIYDGYLHRHHRHPVRLDIPVPRPPVQLLEPRSTPFDIKMTVRQDLGGPIFFSIEADGHVLGSTFLSTLDFDYFDIRENTIPMINADHLSPEVVILDVSKWKLGFWFRDFCRHMYRPWLHSFSGVHAKAFVSNIAAVCRCPGNIDLIHTMFGSNLTTSSLRELFERYDALLGVRRTYKIM